MSINDKQVTVHTTIHFIIPFVSPFVITLKGVDSVGVHNKRQQNDAIVFNNTITPLLKPLAWGDVNFIHTTDSHGWIEGHVLEGSYNGDLGDFYSFTVKMKNKAKKLQKDLFIVDTGDTHDGNGLSDVTSPRGKLTQPLLKKIPYDLLTIGNHELYDNDVTLDVAQNFIPHWKDRYLTSNTYFKDVHNNNTIPIGEKYTYFEGEFGTRVLAYGFIFDFTKNGNVSVVNTVEQEIKKDWFDASLKKYNPDIITLIGHIGLRFKEFYILIDAIRKVYPTIPIAILGGHTHIRDFVVYDPWAAGIESGKYMETIGFFSIHGIAEKKENVTFSRRYLDQNRESYIFHSVDGKKKSFDTQQGRAITNQIYNLRKEYDLSARLGCVPQSYKLSTILPTNTSSVFYLLLNDVLPKMVVPQNSSKSFYFLYNTGGIRYDIPKGTFTTDSAYQLATFENKFYSIENVPYDIVRQILPTLNKEGEVMKKRNNEGDLTPGYVTTDDLGSDGDDTIHSPLPKVNLPAFAASNIPSATMMDIVYVDYFDKQLRDLLLELSGRNWTANQNISDFTGRTVWLNYASKYWNNTDSCNFTASVLG